MLTVSSRFWQFTTLICSRQRGAKVRLDVHIYADDAFDCEASILVMNRSYLHNNKFRLGAAEILKLLSKTECDSRIRGRILTLLVELKSWR